MENNFRKQELLQKYLDNKCSRSELEELFGYLKSGNDDAYHEVMRELWSRISAEKVLKENKADRLLEQVIRTKRPVILQYRRYRRAAAILALAIAVGGILLFSHKKSHAPVIADNVPDLYQNDIEPGGTKAVLQAGNNRVTLSGTEDTSFVLAGNRVQVNDGHMHISKLKPVQYTLTVPRGGTYRMVLADGTQVWLNADSRLIYPSVFNGERREVSLEGEAYFDVAKEAGHPFIVHTKRQDIQVLGTEFNIQAYADERRCITTLVAGKVQVNSADHQVLLTPGEEAVSGEKGQISLQNNADVRQAVAWKNGYFLFNNKDLHEIMRRLSRWYNIRVHYEKSIEPHEYMAIINRDNNISQILGMLEATGTVHFKIEGREVTIMP